MKKLTRKLTDLTDNSLESEMMIALCFSTR